VTKIIFILLAVLGLGLGAWKFDSSYNKKFDRLSKEVATLKVAGVGAPAQVAASVQPVRGGGDDARVRFTRIDSGGDGLAIVDGVVYRRGKMYPQGLVESADGSGVVFVGRDRQKSYIWNVESVADGVAVAASEAPAAEASRDPEKIKKNVMSFFGK